MASTGGECLQMLFHLQESDPNDLFHYEEKKAKSWLRCRLCNVTYCTLELQHLLFQSGSSLGETGRGVERLFESSELPLVEERQRCNITWIFFYKYLIRQKKNRRHFFSLRYYHRCSTWSDQTSVSVHFQTVKSSNNFSMTYWLSVSLLPDSVIEVACIITDYPGDSIDCQFAAVYSIYVLEKVSYARLSGQTRICYLHFST